MNPTIYWLLALVISLGSAVALVWAYRRGGRSQLWVTASVIAVVLLILGYLDWRGQSPKETPMSTYVLIALLPTAAAAGVVAILAARQARPGIQISVAAAVALVLLGGSILTSFYP